MLFKSVTVEIAISLSLLKYISSVLLSLKTTALSWVLAYSLAYFHTKTTQKHQHHNTHTSKQSSQLRFCVHTNNQQRYQKTKNSKFFALHFSVFHKPKLFSYLILPESYKQKHHTTLKVLIFLTSCFTKWCSNIIKKHHITLKHSQNIKITFTSLYFTLKMLLFQSFRLSFKSFRSNWVLLDQIFCFKSVLQFLCAERFSERERIRY